MSYDSKQDHSLNSASRSAFARLAFNIYGGKPSISPNRAPSFTKSPPYTHYNNSNVSTHLSNSYGSKQHNYSQSHEWKFNGTSEIVGIAKLHDTSQNVIISAGKNSLQMIQLDGNNQESPTCGDLLTNSFYLKNKKKFGCILDLKSGHQNYNKLVAASTTTGSIYIFNTAVSNEKSRVSVKLSDHTRAVNSISFNKIDAYLLLSGSQDGSMKLWDLRARNLKPQLTMHGNSDSVRCLQFSPHNTKKFCAVFDSGILQRWDLRNTAQFDRKFNAHTGPGLTLDWNNDLDYVATGGRDKQLQIWNMSGNEVRQYPEHVIYASAPIAKVAFRPSVNPISNIMNSEIALNYLNSEPIVQVYSTKRKYVPLYNIETHDNSITGLVWDSERYLFTASKDKTIVKNDLNFQNRFVDNLNLTGTTWSVTNEMVFIEQRKDSFAEPEQETDNHLVSTYFHQSNSSNYLSTSPTTSSTQLPESLSTSSLASNRPTLSRNSSSMRPAITRDHSHNSHANHFTNSLTNHSHYLIPVSFPIMKTEETLKKLCENYEFDPRAKELLDICDHNSEVASRLGLLRDSKTWKVIKESLIWESKRGITYNDTDAIFDQTEATASGLNKQETIGQDDDDDDYGSEKYHYSTSNSTNYGKSPTLSDFSNDISLKSKPVSESFNSTNSRLNFTGPGAFRSQIIEEELMNSTSEDIPVKIESENKVLKWDDIAMEDSNGGDDDNDAIEEKKGQDDVFLEEEEEEGVDPHDKDSTNHNNVIRSEPIPFAKRASRKSISSLLASLPQNLRKPSPSISVTSSISNSNSVTTNSTQDQRHRTFNRDLFKGTDYSTSFHQTPPQQMSVLTKQLTTATTDTANRESMISANENNKTYNQTLPPYQPKRLIKNCIEFYIDQGDLIMSSTLLLLFNEKFNLFLTTQRDEILFNYLQFLQRLKIWKVFIKFLYLSKLTEVFGNFSNNVKIFCTKCDKLIINEQTKQKFMSDPEVKFGSWYCENCLNIMRCVYCEEPVKKLNLSRLKCGHIGHFHCFENWVMKERMVECPGGCL